jgi:hypothetical protein
MHVAALHDRDKRCRLSGREWLLPDCFLRTRFRLNIDDRKSRIVHSAKAILVEHAVLLLSQNKFVNIVGYPMEFLRSDDQIQVWNFSKQRVAACLCHAAEKTENHVRLLFRKTTKHSHFP